MMGWHWSWYGWLFMSAAMVAFWGMVVYLVIGVSGRPRTGPAGQDTADAILAQRLARGEIGEDEYRRRLATLGDRSGR